MQFIYELKRFRNYVITSFIILFSYLTCFHEVKLPSLKSIDGKLDRVESAGSGRSGESYYLYLKNDSHSYYITAGRFKKEVFELSIKRGDNIGIKVDEAEYKDNANQVAVYEIWTDKGLYLRKEDVFPFKK